MSDNDSMKQKIIVAVILCIIGLLMVEAYLIVRDERSLYRNQFHMWRGFYAMGQRHPLGISDVDSVRTWMTFTYINKVFNLPSEYLKGALSITDSKYPHITIGGVAHEHKELSTVFLEKLKKAIREYFASNAAK